jgi:hypothetical protein
MTEDSELQEVLQRFQFSFGLTPKQIRDMKNRTFHQLFRFWQSPIRDHVSRKQLETFQDFRQTYKEEKNPIGA